MTVALAALGGLLAGWFLDLVADRLPRHEALLADWELGSGRRFAVALATAALAAAVALVRHGAHDIALGLALVVVLVPVTLIDLSHRLIPNRITGPAALAALIIGVATRPSGVATQLIAGAAGGAFLLVFALAYPRGLGMGDVKLAGVLGLFLGSSVAVALFVGLLSAAVLGVGVMARRGVREGRKTAVPLGPFLALGGAVAVLAGPSIVHWYVHSVIK